uniref:Shroom family member 3 n=2 Tax=Iconisemion striatum TaxID=60296 RepID=A0A1A7WUF7_9TELE
MDTLSSWHHSCHASASTTELSSGFDSMESLDPPQTSHLHTTAQNQHHQGHNGSHPAYTSNHQLSSSRSSNSIDHLHSKRDSAYSSFSNCSSLAEYLASTPSYSPERSYSLETVSQRGGGSAELLQARTLYDTQQGLSHEPELSSTSATLLSNNDSRGGMRSGLTREVQGSVGGVCYRSNASGRTSGNMPASNRHSVGPIWGPATGHNSYESLKGAPAPPRRSDSYAAIRNHERPNSWSSLEHGRALRSLQKGSWHHSSGPVASAKGLFGPDGQLHTVIEKSPEGSPTTKPRQGGTFSQPPFPTGPSSGPAGPPSPSSRVFLPTGVYPVPQPEPHFAQAPSSSSCPGQSEVYPALAKESRHQQTSGPRDVNGRDEWISAEENGVQSDHSSPCPSSSYLASSQLRTRALETERFQQQERNTGTHKPHRKTTGGESDCQLGPQRTPNHQGPFIQNFHRPPFEEQNQEFRIPSVLSGPDLRTSTSQGKSDRRDQTSDHSEPGVSSRLAQGQVRPTCTSPAQPQPQAPPTSTSQLSPRHFSDSAAPQYEEDTHSEHPLTRLENALAEVQRCTSSNSGFFGSSHDNGCVSNPTQAPARSLSVMDKVSRFERREHGGKQRSQSISNKPSQTWMTDKNRGAAPCGADDLRNMLERSTKVSKTHRTISFRGVSGEYMKHRKPSDPISALQRSRSSFQLDGSREGDNSKDFPWKQEVQQIPDPLQDSSSIRWRDISSSVSSQQPPIIPAKNHSLEKKGPKTKPKPQGVVITPQSLVTSPHTPKERHVVSPDIPGQSPPPLPRVPPVGPPPLTRICGRKRLTADQKKRSFSEPENMNEVGVSDPETAAFFRRGGENSVADRRKMFELAAVRVGKGAFQNTMSRSDLRQVRQDALAEYVERKQGVRRGEGGQSSKSRPRSAYLQYENSSHSDTFSLSSTSSLLSLQESTPDQSFHPEERRLCSTLPSGGDLRSFQSNLFYPGRVTTPRPPAHLIPSTSGSAHELQTQIYQDLNPEADISRPSLSQHRDSTQDHDQQTAEPRLRPRLSKKLNEALQRAESPHRSARSVSAEDLLEQLEKQPSSPRHHRSQSSPTAEKLNQDFIPDEVKMFDVSFSEPGRCALAADRPADIHTSGDLVSPQTSRYTESTPQPAGASQDLLHTPVTRRERQRNSERQRAQSTSTLAASVGLPCPFSPAGTPDGGTSQWKASERLSQANLDAIAFPDLPQTGASDKKPDRHSLSDVLADNPKGEFRTRAFSLEATGRSTVPPVTSAPPPFTRSSGRSPSPPSSARPSLHQHLSSLRISESSLFESFDQQKLRSSLGLNTQEDLDDVFFQNPPPAPPSPHLQETIISEDFPPPPPPLEMEAEHASVQSFSPDSEHKSVLIRTSVSRSSPPLNPQPSTSISSTAEDDVLLEYQPLLRREKTPEELRAEVLARQLVLQDPSLAPLLDTWGGKSTVELMEEIFSNNRLTDKSQKHPDERIQDESFSPAQSSASDQRKETNLDEEETDLSVKKVELCEALRSSLVVLQQEKRVLSEELRHHRALGSSIEALVQDQLKANEKEKYCVFIGDLERIVNLLLSLCNRLSRIDRSLLSLQRDGLGTEDAAEEKDSLLHKRSLLLRQTEDARELKDNLDRRQRVVQTILSGYLTKPQLQDYRRFVSAKPSLLIGQRHLDGLIQQGEEQLTQLAESLPAKLTEAHGWSAVGLLSNSASCSSLGLPSVIPGPAHSTRPTTVTSL